MARRVVLVLAATPIGDPEDASPRLARLIAEADVIAAEDTRRLRRLAAALGVQPAGRLVSHHEHNEAASVAGLVRILADGGTVLLVTDAGMPSVSDPGLRLVRAVLEAGLPVTAVPGPSAVLTALALSGLPTDRFCFEGFLPRSGGRRRSAVAELAGERRTLVFFESPRRLADTLAALAEGFGADRPAAVCRELTKTHEEVRRGPLGELAQWAREREVLGEVTLVVGGRTVGAVSFDAADPAAARQVADLVAAVRQRQAAGLKLSAAVAEVAAEHGAPRGALYDAVLKNR